VLGRELLDGDPASETSPGVGLGASRACDKVQSFFFFFFAVLGLEFRAYTFSHSTSPFCERFSLDRFSGTICPGWL
jgi:hypothetical protein